LRFTGSGIETIRGSLWNRSGLVALLLVFSLWASSAQAAYRVTGISFSLPPGEIQVHIRTDGPVRYDFFTMEETQPQLVIDLIDAVHALDHYRFEPPATGVIQRVRTSQYRPYPHPVVRVVLDLRRMTPYETAADGQGLTVTIATPAVDGTAERSSPGASDVSPGDPEPSVSAGTVDESSGGESPGGEAAVGTAGKTGVKRKEPESGRSAVAESPATEVSPVTSSRTESSPPESLPPEPVPMESSPPKSVPVESSPPESSSSAGAEASADTTASDDQSGSLMARLAALGIREPVSYHSGGRRDPFVPLPAQQEVEFGQTPLPDVEKLSIVGILQGIDGYRALAQDDEDNGYVLRKGDRVLYGYVARIEAERVIFYLNSRGLDRTVILKIPH
jgi:hypothetical protein